MSKNPFRDPRTKPPFVKGDLVTPKRGKHCYAKWRHGEFREILDVSYECTNDPYGSWVLVIFNPLKAEYTDSRRNSKYNPANFTKEAYIMPSPLGYSDHANCRCKLVEKQPTETAQYLGMRVEQNPNGSISFNPITSFSALPNVVENEITGQIEEGEEYIIVKTFKRIKAMPPKPPIQITECR